jgi:hypothetical protein
VVQREWIAVLGTELWLLPDGEFKSAPLGLSGMVYGSTVKGGTEESWISFIARAEAETRDTLETFQPSSILERARYCSTWFGSEAEFQNLSTNSW